MDWFPYFWDLRYERVHLFSAFAITPQTQDVNLKSGVRSNSKSSLIIFEESLIVDFLQGSKYVSDINLVY